MLKSATHTVASNIVAMLLATLGHIWYVILRGLCYNVATSNDEACASSTGYSQTKEGKQNRQEWTMPTGEVPPLELEYRTTEQSVKNLLHSHRGLHG